MHLWNVCVFSGKTLAATLTTDGRDSALHCLSWKNQEHKCVPSGNKQQRDYQCQRLYNKNLVHGTLTEREDAQTHKTLTNKECEMLNLQMKCLAAFTNVIEMLRQNLLKVMRMERSYKTLSEQHSQNVLTMFCTWWMFKETFFENLNNVLTMTRNPDVSSF